MELIRVPALNDNYIWVLVDGHQQCIIVDPQRQSLCLK
ncbi:Hydroxyacylglutathione hydrolase [Providencia rettgeri]|uniref:Hydroxyacylglutathione hydrolase n=1 Tax=Providencia rettgeri TaxID=587 RepID=A0A379FNJ0_PRORE|nr:Hydroxyacylglutathione hydrolase [Providencia rettgeri]